MPRVWDKNIVPTKAYRDYFNTYIQRDLKDIATINNIESFIKFVKLCAGRVGCIFNASNLSNDIGVSVPTINSWMNILQTSYTVFLLQPYYENFGTRLIKSPKIYFYDVGLASYLLGIEDKKQVERDPLKGGLFENFVVMELLKKRFNSLKDCNLYFYRDKYINEVDVLLKFAHQFKLIEIKSAQTFNKEFIKGNEKISSLLKERVTHKYIVYNGKDFGKFLDNNVINWKNVASVVNLEA
jgi:uncharacterized protein